MSKITALEAVNKVLNNLGEPVESSLASLSGLAYMVFHTINEVLHDLATEYKLKPLEASGTLSLVTATSTYSQPADFQSIDKDSLRYDDRRDVTYLTAQAFDRARVKRSNTGEPEVVYQWADVFNVWPIPTSAANGKSIVYRYWKMPTLYTTASPSGTSYIPEGFDLTLLADLATYKILHYKHNEEAAAYYAKVYGDGRMKEGSLDKFKNLYGSPDIIDGNIMTEPMENTLGVGGRLGQTPITG